MVGKFIKTNKRTPMQLNLVIILWASKWNVFRV